MHDSLCFHAEVALSRYRVAELYRASRGRRHFSALRPAKYERSVPGHTWKLVRGNVDNGVSPIFTIRPAGIR